MLLRLAYLAVANGLAMLRLLPMSDRARDVEILTLRHQIAVLERQLHGRGYRVRFAPADRVGAENYVCPDRGRFGSRERSSTPRGRLGRPNRGTSIRAEVWPQRASYSTRSGLGIRATTRGI